MRMQGRRAKCVLTGLPVVGAGCRSPAWRYTWPTAQGVARTTPLPPRRPGCTNAAANELCLGAACSGRNRNCEGGDAEGGDGERDRRPWCAPLPSSASGPRIPINMGPSLLRVLACPSVTNSDPRFTGCSRLILPRANWRWNRHMRLESMWFRARKLRITWRMEALCSLSVLFLAVQLAPMTLFSCRWHHDIFIATSSSSSSCTIFHNLQLIIFPDACAVDRVVLQATQRRRDGPMSIQFVRLSASPTRGEPHCAATAVLLLQWEVPVQKRLTPGRRSHRGPAATRSALGLSCVKTFSLALLSRHTLPAMRPARHCK